MKAKEAVFTAVCIRPQQIRELIERIPDFSATSVYHAIHELKKEGLVVVQRRQVSVSPTYRAQKLREIYLKALSYGVDPGRLTEAPVLKVVKAVKTPRSLAPLAKQCGLHISKVRRVVRFLRDAGLLSVVGKKPLVVGLAKHPLVESLSDFVGPHPEVELPYLGHFPSKRIAAPPGAIERALFEYQDRGMVLGGAGLSFKGGEDKPCLEFAIVSEGPPTPEDILLKQIQAPDGLEFALHTLRACKVDFNRLLRLAIERDMVNETGCFLDLVHLYAPRAVPRSVVKEFMPHVSPRKRPFPRGAKPRKLEFDWLHVFERTWNVELRMPVSGIAQEARNLW